jgi:hypothetical protein
LLSANAIASFSAWLGPAMAVAHGVPVADAAAGSRGSSMTVAPVLAAYRMPRDEAAARRDLAAAQPGSPLSSVTLMERTLAAGATRGSRQHGPAVPVPHDQAGQLGALDPVERPAA